MVLKILRRHDVVYQPTDWLTNICKTMQNFYPRRHNKNGEIKPGNGNKKSKRIEFFMTEWRWKNNLFVYHNDKGLLNLGCHSIFLNQMKSIVYTVSCQADEQGQNVHIFWRLMPKCWTTFMDLIFSVVYPFSLILYAYDRAEISWKFRNGHKQKCIYPD